MYKENTSSVLQFGLIVSLRLVSICLFYFDETFKHCSFF